MTLLSREQVTSGDSVNCNYRAMERRWLASPKGQDAANYPAACQRTHYNEQPFDQNANDAKDRKLSPKDLCGNEERS